MPAVVDCQRCETLETEHAAGGLEPAAEGMPRQPRVQSARPQRTDKRVVGLGAGRQAICLPLGQVEERTAVPPEWDDPRTATLGRATADAKVRSRQFAAHIGDLERRDLAGPKAAAAGEADEGEVEASVRRTRG